MRQIITIVILAMLCHIGFSQTLDKDTILLGEVDIAAEMVFEKKQSALKTMAPLKHIPIATTSVNRQMLEYRSVNNINDAMHYATGVRSTVNYGGCQTFRFRGFGKPVIMVDGMRDERMNWSSSAPLTGLTAVESIEFLKGPASVMYGHSAVGGILNIVRKQPTAQSTANARVGYGSWNAKRAEVGAGGALCPNMSYRFDAGYSDSDGWRDNKQNSANVYFAINMDVSSKDVLKLKVGANDDFYATETGMPAVTKDIFDASSAKQVYSSGDLPSTFKREQRYNDPSDFLTHNNYNTALAWIHTFSPHARIENSVSYNDDDIDYFSTEELSYLTSDEAVYEHYYMNGDERKYICLDTLQRTFPLRFSHKTKTLQYNADIYHKFETGAIKHNVVGGYSFMYVDRTSYTGYNAGEDVYGDGLFGKVSVVDPILNQGYLKTKFSRATPMHEQTHGLYFQDLIDLSSSFKVMLGGRLDHYRYAYRTATVTNGLDYSDATPKQSINNTAFSYRVGAVYLPSKDLSLYVSASSFFKPYRTTFNPDYIYINKDGERFYPADGKQVYEPEQGYQLEVGLKWELNAIMSLNAGTYYILKENIVEYLGQTNDEANQRINGQVGAVDSKGFELDVIAHPCKGLSINAGYGYNRTQYKDFADNAYLEENNNEGNALRHTPENQLFAWVNYTVSTGALKNLSLGVGTRYTDDVYVNTSNTMVLPSYRVSDATLAYTFDKVTLRFNANNIADEYYFDNTVYSNQYISGTGLSYEASVIIKF